MHELFFVERNSLSFVPKMSGEKCEKCVVDFREPSKGLVYNASDCSPRSNVAMLF